MKIVWKIVAALMGLLLIGGIAFLAFWEIPAPRTPIEKVLPNDRFPR